MFDCNLTNRIVLAPEHASIRTRVTQNAESEWFPSMPAALKHLHKYGGFIIRLIRYLYLALAPTSEKQKFYGVTGGFTRLIMKIKYIFYGLFSSPPPLFKIPSFMFDLRVIAAKCVMLRCKV